MSGVSECLIVFKTCNTPECPHAVHHICLQLTNMGCGGPDRFRWEWIIIHINYIFLSDLSDQSLFLRKLRNTSYIIISAGTLATVRSVSVRKFYIARLANPGDS